jgi:hypothetical protein
VGFYVAVADALPRTAVPFVGCGVAIIPVVLFVNNLLMLGAVLLVPAAAIALGEPTAAGVGTGTLGFGRALGCLLACIKESHRGLFLDGLLLYPICLF